MSDATDLAADTFALDLVAAINRRVGDFVAQLHPDQDVDDTEGSHLTRSRIYAMLARIYAERSAVYQASWRTLRLEGDRVPSFPIRREAEIEQ